MRIEDLRTDKNAGRARIAATVIWEDCDRAVEELYFETSEEFAGDLTCDPGAFLLATVVPAMHYRERRLLIDADICPELLEGLETAMGWLRQWYYKPGEGFLDIETKGLKAPSHERKPERAGFFFSGGIDSFATLQSNSLHFPPEHPRAFRDGILVYGLEQDDPEIFKHVLASFSGAADALGITLIPVYTNLYLNYRREDAANAFRFWGDEFGGSALAAVAHAFARRFTSISIAATYSVQKIEPYGSHPLLDPNYSSHGLRILHDGINLTRFEKVKMVADCDAALQNIRVCNRYKNYQAGMLNCGKCEKCVRTMLALTALGALSRTQAFPRQEVTPELVNGIDMTRKGAEDFLKLQYEELLAPLSSVGRHDLVRALERKLNHKGTFNWKKRLLRMNRKHPGSSLRKIRNIFN